MAELASYIIERKPVEDIKALLETGVDVNYRNKSGETALYSCAIGYLTFDGSNPICSCHASIQAYILNDQNVKKIDRKFHEKDEQRSWTFNVVKLLIKYGADVNIPNSRGVSTLSLFVLYKLSSEIIELVLDSNADVNSVDVTGNTALHYYACYRNSVKPDLLKRMIERISNIDIINNNGFTPLMSFVYHGCSVELIDCLLQSGADMGAKSGQNFSVLHIYANGYNMFDFCKKNSLDLLRFLLGKGGDVYHLDDGKRTPLITFVSKHLPIEPFAVLFDHIANVNESSAGNSLISNVPPATCKKTCKKAKESNVSTPSEAIKTYINYTDEEGIAAIHMFALCSTGTLHDVDINIVKLLINYGANVNLKTKSGSTALHLFIHRLPQREDLINALLESGADVNTQDEEGDTVLHLYAGIDTSQKYNISKYVLHEISLDLLERMIEKHTDINLKNNLGKTPLILYFERSWIDLKHIEALVNAGADVNAVSNSNSVIHLLKVHLQRKLNLQCTFIDPKQVHTDILNILQLLIDKGADINVKDMYGRTPLMVFFDEDCSDVFVETLLDNDANVNSVDFEGNTVLHYPYRFNRKYETLKRILDKFRNVNARNINGQSPLMAFINKTDHTYYNQSNELSRLAEFLNIKDEFIVSLLNRGADVNIKDVYGVTVLHYYAKHTDIRFDIFKRILDKFNDISAAGYTLGFTPLMSFVREGHGINYIISLLNAGANIFCIDNFGNSILHIFAPGHKTNKNLEVLDLLIRQGASVNATNLANETVLQVFLDCRLSAEYVRMILDKGSINVGEQDYLSYILNCKKPNNPDYIDVLQLLLEYGCVIDGRWCSYGTRLEDALEMRLNNSTLHIDYFKTFFNFGARFFFPNDIESVFYMMSIWKERDKDIYTVLKLILLDCSLQHTENHYLLSFEYDSRCRREFFSYAGDIEVEINKMKSYPLMGRYTIFSFLMERDLRRLGLCFMQIGPDIDNLEIEFPQYFEVIESKMKVVSSLADVLRTIRGLTISTHSTRDGGEVSLNPDCVGHISRFLGIYDLNKLQRASRLVN